VLGTRPSDPTTCSQTVDLVVGGRWSWNGTACNDVDECAADPLACEGHAECMNTEGGFECKCPQGYLHHPASPGRRTCLPPPTPSDGQGSSARPWREQLKQQGRWISGHPLHNSVWLRASHVKWFGTNTSSADTITLRCGLQFQRRSMTIFQRGSAFSAWLPLRC
jgi:hypothetical protein